MKHAMVWLVFLLTVLSSTSLAQFEPWQADNGVKIRQGDHVMWTETLESHANGDYAVAWSAATHGTQNVYLQIYSANGSPRFPSEGLRITDSNWPQERPILLPYGTDEWIVGWRDYRYGSDKLDPGVLAMQRVTADGTLLWPNSGVVVTEERYSSSVIDLLPCVDGDILAVWAWGEGRVQRYTPDGVAVYPEPVVISDEWIQDIVSDGQGGFWFTSTINSHNTIVVNRFQPEGTLAWDTPGLTPAPNTTGCDVVFSAASDGADGLILSWCYQRDDTPVFVQRLAHDGTLAWSEDQTMVMDTEIFPSSPRVFEGEMPGEFFLTYEVGHSSLLGVDMLAQRYLCGDQRAETQWQPGGTGIVDGYNLWSRFTSVVSDGQGGAWISWAGAENEGDSHQAAWVTRVDAFGQTAWLAGPTLSEVWHCGGLKLFEHNGVVSYYGMDHLPNRQELRVRDYDAVSGALLDSYTLGGSLGGNISEPCIERGETVAWLAWSDQRRIAMGDIPYVQCVDVATGTPLFDDNGLSVSPEYDLGDWKDRRVHADNIRMDVMADESAVVTWLESKWDAEPGTQYRNLVQRITPDGVLECGDDGLELLMPSDHDGRYLIPNQIVAGSDGTANLYSLMRCDDDPWAITLHQVPPGGSMDENDRRGVIVVDDVPYGQVWDVVTLPDHSMLMIYSKRFSAADTKVYATRIDEEGQALWADPVLLFDMLQPCNAICQVEVEVLDDWILAAVGTSDSGAAQSCARIQGISTDGDILWADGPMQFDYDDGYRREIDIAAAGHNQFWFSLRNGGSILLDKYAITGDCLTDESIVIAGDYDIMYEPFLTSDSNGGVYATWISGDTWLDLDLFYTHLQADTRFALFHTAHGENINDAANEIGEMHVVPDQEGGFLAVWNDWRGRSGELEGDDVYCIRINDLVDDVTDQPTANRALTWSLAPVSPNPFNPSTTVRFTLADRCDTRVTVVDILGREVATLLSRSLPAGEHQVAWTGQLRSGGAAASGVYFIRLDTPDYTATRKAVLMK